MIFRLDLGRTLRQILLLVFIEILIFLPVVFYNVIPDAALNSVVKSIYSQFPIGGEQSIVAVCIRICYFISCTVLIIYGSLALSRDAANGRIDFLLARPVTRLKIYVQRLLSGLLTVILSCAVMLALSLAALTITGVQTDILLFFINVFGIEIMFYLLSYMWSSICKTKTSAVCASLLCFFATYTAGVFPQVVEKLWITSYFSPYHFAFDTEFDIIKLAIAAAIAVISLIAGILVYKKSQFYEL